MASSFSSRRGVQRARRRGIGLMVVLLSTILVVFLDRLSLLGFAIHYRNQTEAQYVLWYGSMLPTCVGPLFWGVLVDRYAMRRVVGLGLIGWCCLSIACAVQNSAIVTSVLLVLRESFPSLIIVGAIVAIARTSPTRRTSFPIASVLMAFFLVRTPDYAFYARWFPYQGDAWRFPLLLLTAAVILNTGLLWFLVPREGAALGGRPPAHDGPTMIRGAFDLLARRDVLIVVALLCFYYTVSVPLIFRVFRDLFNTHEKAHDGLLAMWGPFLVMEVTYLANAAVSGAIYGRVRVLAKARRPFIVAGFLLCGLAALFPLAPQGVASIGLSIMVAVGVGMLGLLELLPVDLALPGQEGRTIGLIESSVLTFAAVVFFLLELAFGLERRVNDEAVLVAVVALVAAALSYRLLAGIARPRPVETLRERLGATFE